ncbi:MAG: ABC transporter permease [Deltaproteobacteria bacterium]|nr:ABC transporter permease [Deltaproteobacteria bacterium]
MSVEAGVVKAGQGGQPGWAARRLAGIGAGALDNARAARLLYSIFIRTLYYSVRGRREKGAVLRACYGIGNRSLFFLTAVMGFVGMIMVFHSCTQINRITGDLHLVGATYIQLVVRDFAASVGSMMLATRVGAGIAAEIGSMVVTDQVDALRMCAAEPVDYLIVPRFKASVVMTTVLLVWAMFVMEVSGMLTAWGMFNVNPRIFWNLSMVDFRDLATGLTKCLAFGAAIPIVSGYCGLTTFGGAEGVGWATTRAVVWSCFATILLNFIISTTALYVFWA